jgi:hypothetical protein
MRLLFDQNLSFKLCDSLDELFPKSAHVRLLGGRRRRHLPQPRGCDQSLRERPGGLFGNLLDKAAARIDHGDLTALLYVQGYGKDAFVEK